MATKYTDKELAALISKVEEDFNEHLKKAEKPAVQKKEEVANTQATETIEKTEEKYNQDDILEMDELYSSMTKSEKEAHYQSVKKSLFGNEEKVVKMDKTEEVKVVKEESDKQDLLKSELEEVKTQLEKKEKDYVDLEKNFSNLVEKLGKFMKKSSIPDQKAITDIEYVKKSEENESEVKKIKLGKLSKEEINATLNKKIRSGKLEKSDRELINNYFFNNADLDAIKHLLV